MTNCTERYSAFLAQSALLRWTHLCDKKSQSNHQTFSTGGRGRLGTRLKGEDDIRNPPFVDLHACRQLLASFPGHRPAFCRLQYALPYCKRRKAGRGTGTRLDSCWARSRPVPSFSLLTIRESWKGLPVG